MKTHKVLARLSPQSWDDETQTVEAILSTGAGVKRRDARGEFVEYLDIDGSTVADLPPLLNSHRTASLDDLLGRVFDVRKEKGALIARLHIDREEIAARVRSGVIRDVSIGYHLTGVTERTDPKTNVRSKTARVHVHEASLVVIPADPGAQVRNQPMTKKTTGADPALENDVDVIDTSATTAETRAEIRTIIKRAGGTPEQADELIDAGATAEQARAAAYELITSRQPRIRVGVSHEDPAALLERQIDGLYARAAGVKPADNAREFAGLTILEHADLINQRNGVRTFGMSREQRLAMSIRSMGTSDLPNLLQGVSARSLMAKYQVAQSPLAATIAKKTSLTDFRENARLRAGEFGSLEELGEHGEIKHTSRTESKNSIALKTFARRIDYSMKAMLNDDLSALTDASDQFGIAAAARDAEELIALLAANPAMDTGFALFSNQHNNTLASGEIDVETVSAARLAMRQIKGLDGETLLNIAPKYLVVSSELETVAEQFLAAYNAQSFSETNPFASKLTLVVEPRLPAFQWFIWADPALAPVLELAHLAGREGPQIESQQSWDTWGVSFRCIHHVGAAAIGWRGAFRIEDGEPEGEG